MYTFRESMINFDRKILLTLQDAQAIAKTALYAEKKKKGIIRRRDQDRKSEVLKEAMILR